MSADETTAATPLDLDAAQMSPAQLVAEVTNLRHERDTLRARVAALTTELDDTTPP